MSLKYFAESENRLVEATVVELRRTRLLVENLLDGRRWLIPFYAVNLDAVDTDIKTSAGQQGLDRSQLKVGDEVGYRDRQNRDTYGRVLALNPKTATIRTNGGDTWRVAYRLLFPVIEGREAGASAAIEVEARLLED